MSAFRLMFALFLVAITAQGQGTINFGNFIVASGGSLPDGPFTVNAPVFDVGGVGKLEGPQYVAQLYVVSSGVVGDPVPFRTGPFAGYWDAAVRVVPNSSPGSTVTVAVYAWDLRAGSTYEAAQALGRAGASNPFSLVLGGGGNPAAELVGLSSFTLIPIPEPFPILLGLAFTAGWSIQRWLRPRRRS